MFLLGGALLTIPVGALMLLDPRWGLLLPVVLGAVVALRVQPLRREHAALRERHWRLSRFAKDNGATFAGRLRDPSRPGTMFALGFNRRTVEQVSFSRPRWITVGDHRCTYGGHHNATPWGWGFATTRLKPSSPLPDLQLRTRAPDSGHSELPRAEFAVTDVPMGGPGGEAFVIRTTQRNAARVRELLPRTLFRPDVLALLAEQVVDVEIVDDHLVLAVDRGSTLEPEHWQWLMDLTVAAAEALEE